ncbi:ANK-REP-REGION domain-containing protein [Mycena kentingensis (nom. inval.)]|nr:ANK-REP-REGION domain-containing protein [Mycena kentingensis (nom. inval.)]
MSSPPPLPDLRLGDGALYLGVIFATYLQGMLTVQAYHYYEQYPNDSKVLKLLVATVWCLDLAHLGMVVEVPWLRLVLNWGNMNNFTHSTRVLSYQLILIALPTILCQGFYLHRKKNLLLVGICGAASLCSFSLDIFLAIHTTKSVYAYKQDTPEIVSMFGIAAATDLIIALSLVSTNFVVTRVIRYAVATGLLSSVVAIFSLIANLALPNTRIFMAGHICLGHMYTNALLANLNSRANLRSTLTSGNLKPLGGPSSGLGATTGGTSMSAPMFFVAPNRNEQSGVSDTLNEYSMGEMKRSELSDA